MEIVRKSVSFEVKTVSDAGAFSGWAAVFNNVDADEDMILKGAFADTLIESKGVFPILWQHSTRDVIGMNVKAEERDTGLWVEGQLLVKDPLAQKAREYMALALKLSGRCGLSIGYRVPAGGSEMQNGIRILRKISLAEYSVVTFASNAWAQVTGVKGISDADWVDLRAAQGQLLRLQALASANGQISNEALQLYASLQAILYRWDSYGPTPGLGTGNTSVTQGVGVGGKTLSFDLASKISAALDQLEM